MFFAMMILSAMSRFALIILRVFWANSFAAIDSTLVAILGWLFAPCTTITYLSIIHSNGELGVYWPLMVITVLIDFAAGLAPLVDEKCDTMNIFKH